MSVTIERPSTQAATHQEVYDWLHSQAENSGLKISILSEEEQMQSGMLSLPVYIEGAKDVIDNILKLKKLEDSWNDREPQPQPSLFLVSVKNPVQRAIWNRIDKAVERKMKAADAVADAKDEAEERETLAELRAARAEEVQAEQENKTFQQRSQAV